MTGNGRKKVSREKQAVKENQEKNLNHVKQKTSTVKAKVKKDAHNPPEQHDKVAKKKSRKTLRPKKDVHNPLDRIRQMEPQKGSLQQHVYRFTGCLKGTSHVDSSPPAKFTNINHSPLSTIYKTTQTPSL